MSLIEKQRVHWLLAAVCSVCWASQSPAQSPASQVGSSVWVYPTASGRLIHQPDAQGNRLVDNSGVGYMGGAVPLPNVPTVMTISPVPGDNTANVQGALNQMAALAPDTNGFRGALLLTAGYYAISNTISINASGIVLRGVGNGTNGTVIYSTSTNGPDNGPLKSQVQGVVVVSGSFSPIPINGTSNNIIDNYVPVGARSFTVDGAGVLNVGDKVIIHRPSTTSWISALGMDQLNTPWAAGSVDVDAERVITRIEGNRIMIDQPITTALDQRYGGGSIYAYTWPQRFNKIGIENLRGQSTYNTANTNDEDHAWVFLRFSNTEDCWVRNVISQYFGKSCVSIQTGVKHATVVNCQCLDPISLVLSERRYAFDLNSCQLCLVENCFTRQDRHSFITQSLTDGPDVFVDGLSQQAYDLVGPHVMWASGVLFDNITTDNGVHCENVGNAGAAGDPGQGWIGANCTFWNCAAGSISNGFSIQSPPTARNWLIGAIGPLVGGSSGNAGPHGPGTYDSLQTNVYPNSLYYAQLQDHFAAPSLQTREYRLGSINLFTSNTPVTIDPAWSNAVQTAAGALPLDKFDVVSNGHWVPFTFNFTLGTNEQIVAATLSVSMLAASSGDTNDVLYLDSLTNSFLFSDLGWMPLSTISTNPSVRVLDLSGQLGLLSDGKLNVAFQSDVAVDWAELQLQVAPILTTFTNVLSPIADATARGGAFATNNFGDAATLTVNESSLPDNEQKSYLRWDLNGVTGQILQARVRLVPVNASGGLVEQGATFANTNTWDEAGITWSNQPGGGKRFATWLPAQSVPVEFVVPPQFMDTVAAQSNQLCLQLYSIRNVGVLGSVNYASREYPDPSLRPQLILVMSNTAPAIFGLSDLSIFQDTSAGPISFTINDAESPNNLVLSAISGNPALLPVGNIVFGGSGTTPTLALTPADGQTGTAAVSIIVTDPGGLTATNTFNLTVSAYTGASFLVAASPASQSIAAGTGTTYGINITSTNGTFTDDVNLSASGFPPGATAGFTPPTVSGSGTSTLSINTATNTPGGSYTIKVTGTGGGLTRSTTATLNVSGFVLSASPASQNVATNGTANFNVGLIFTNGYNGNVSFTVDGLPPGANAIFNPATATTSTNATLTVTTSAATPPGIYPLTITGTDGTLAQTSAVTLNVFAFSLSAIPSVASATTSDSANYTITVTGTPGISNTVNLNVSGLPSGATASFLPLSITGSGETTLNIGTALATPPGNYPLTITGTSGTQTNTTTVTLIVTDFGFVASPGTQTVLAGNATNFTATISAINGFDDEVDFSVTGLPPNATGGFTPSSVTGAGSSTFTVATATNTPSGTYLLTLIGTDGTLVHTTNVTLKVAGFALASSPTSRTVTSGGSANFTATVTVTNGFSGTVALSLSGLPAGVAGSFSPPSITGSGSSTLSLTTSNITAAGVYPLTVTATSGSIVYTAIATLKVQDFSIAAAPPAQSVTAGVGTSFNIAVTTNNNFTGNTALTISGLPPGVAATFNPSTVTNTGNSTLSITISNTTAGGAYNLTITGTSGSLVRSTNVTLNVTGLTNNFALNTTPAAQTVNPGGNVNFTTTVGGSVGFTNTVNLSVSGMPSGMSASFNPSAVTNGNGSSTLNVIASNSVTPGIYPLTIIGTSGSLAQTNTVTVNVFSFAIDITQVSRTVVAGSGTSFSVTATGTTGISNNVNLSVSGLPTNTLCSYAANPMVITNTGSDTLNITTATNTPAGNYTITAIGVFGTLTNSTTSTLKVTDFSLGVSPASLSVLAGNSTNCTVTVGAINSFSANVAFTASGLPPGAVAGFNPTSLNGSGTSTLTISTLTSTPPGTYTVAINGISGALTHSSNITFVVVSANHPPALTAIPNYVVNPGVTLTFTNTATDTDTPPQTLTYSLVSGPATASVNAGSGVFLWRPKMSQANTTNLAAVAVTDNGSPSMSATQSFSITVNPLTLPTLSVLGLTNGVLAARVSGIAGPDLTFQTSSNLSNWSTLSTTNSPPLPFDFTDPNANQFSNRFYRALLGP
jgi:uncharacterized membrane protein